MKSKSPGFIKKIGNRFNKSLFGFYNFAMDKISRSIRLEMMLSFVICLLAAFIVSTWYDGYYKEKHIITEVDYSSGIESILEEYTYVKNEIAQQKLSVKSETVLKGIITEAYKLNEDNTSVKLYVSDLQGKVLYKTQNAKEDNIDIYDFVKKTSEFKELQNNSTVTYSDNGILKKRIALDATSQCVEISGIEFSDEKVYLIITGKPTDSTVYIKPQGSTFAVFQGIAAFILLFYFLTSKKMRYIEKISEGLFEIGKNNLDYRIEIEGKDELAKLSENINFMIMELNRRIEGERNAEKSKSDLITNVSHDLRTPLTSIKGYIALLKDKRYKNEEEFMDYLNIAYTKSEKLEALINDLFEYTKLSNKGITLQLHKISIKELLEQLIEELYVICEKNNIVIRTEMPNEEVYAEIDGDKMARVFENLLINAIRYSTKPGEIKLKIDKKENSVIVSVENKCDDINEEQLEKLFDRFYRVDKSRAENTGGSGLGLAIAKSIVELHGGKIWVRSQDNNIVFYVEVAGTQLNE